MAYVLKINCKPIMYIFLFELARFIGIESSLRFILIDQVISMLEQCHMILHKFRYQKNGLLCKEIILKVKVSFFLAHIVFAVQ